MKSEIRLSLFLFVIGLISCQKEDVIVQSLYDLSGAPLRYDDSRATRHLQVAAVSITPSLYKADNVEKLKAKAVEIKKTYPQTELILYGEAIWVGISRRMSPNPTN